MDESLQSEEEYENDVGEGVSRIGGLWELNDANAAVFFGMRPRMAGLVDREGQSHIALWITRPKSIAGTAKEI